MRKHLRAASAALITARQCGTCGNLLSAPVRITEMAIADA